MEKQSDAVFMAGEMLEQPKVGEKVEEKAEEKVTEEATEEKTVEQPDAGEPAKEEKPKQSPDADRVAKQAREYTKRVEKRAHEAEERARKSERDAARLLEALNAYGYGLNGEDAEDIAATVIAAQKGVDAATVKRQYEQADKALEEQINNDPRIQAMLEFESQQAAQIQMQADLAAIKAEFPFETAKRLDDIKNVDAYVGYIQKGYEPVDAYYLANKNTTAKTPKVNDKEHLIPAGGNAGGDGGKEIPSGELGTWRDAYPDLTAAQLRAKYNNYMKIIGG